MEQYVAVGNMYATYVPNNIALANIIKARVKMIRDALPNILISFPATCCPTTAEMVATTKK